MQNNLEEINYFLEKSNHIFNHTFNMRNQSSLDFNSICKAHPKLDFGQKSKLNEILSQFKERRVAITMKEINKQILESGIAELLKDSFEFHTLATKFPLLDHTLVIKTLDETLSEEYISKIYSEGQNLKGKEKNE